MSKKIEKAQVGDEKTLKDGVYYVHSLNAKGQPLWRKKKDGSKPAKDDSSGSGKKTAPTPAPKGKNDDAPTGKPKPTLKTSSGKQKSLDDMDFDEIMDWVKTTDTNLLAQYVNKKDANKDIRQVAFNELKTRKDYDKTKVDSSDLTGGYVPKPTAKVQYKTKKPEVDIEVPENWTIKVKDDKGNTVLKKVSASGMRKLYAGKSDDDLLKILNNPKASWQNRQLAYEEAAARGIDEDKFDVSGKLQSEWDAAKRRHDLSESMKEDWNEEEADSIDVDFKGFDHEEFMKEFIDNNDPGWLNPLDPRVQKAFNGFKTLTSRQQYDALKTMYEPTMPGYLNVDNKIGFLNQQYDDLIKSKTAPLFISAGGAGAGKSYSWKKIAEEENNLVPLTGDSDPNSTDWGYVMCSDPEDEKEFRKMLAKYNGTYLDDNGREKPHILVFDDADKILTSKAGAMKALMKKITDNDPRNRIFVNPDTGESEVFKGAIVITTNKDVGAITAANEDAKAIISRGIVNDMKFTRAESMSLIDKRYEKMSLGEYQEAFENQFPNEADQKKVRKAVRDWLAEHLDEADPAKFTPRAFIQVMSIAGPIIARGGAKPKMVAGTVQIGTNVPWEVQALNIIKAEDNDIEKAEENEFTEEAMVENKKKLEADKAKAKKSDKKRYDVMYGDSAIDLMIFGETNDKSSTEEDTEKKGKKPSKKKSNKKESEVKKAFELEIGEMSLQEAESFLLG